MPSAETKGACVVFLTFLGAISVVNVVEYIRPATVDRYEISTERTDVKVILSWNPFFGDAYYGFGEGEGAFERHGCEYTNCRITSDKLEMPQHRFHAILFHGFEFYELFYGKPRHRGVEQYYVFMSLESARRASIPRRLRRFFNLTMTYRLDSDVPWPYFRVRDASGDIVAPAASVAWLERPLAAEANRDLLKAISGKRKKIAWFVSNCGSTNGRETYVAELRRHVEVDVFGACGDRECPVGEHGRCLRMLSEQYHFYLAFENSHCEDYLTEKVLTALHSETVPIVFGHAELSRFLPPHSFIDANSYSPKDLAEEVNALIADRERYAKYFWWKDVYRFEKSMPADEFPAGQHPFCALCRVLNERPDASDRDLYTWWMGTEKNPVCIR